MADLELTDQVADVGPQLTVLKFFATPVLVAAIPDAEAINVELKQIILARERTSDSVERSNRGGWQSSWDMHE